MRFIQKYQMMPPRLKWSQPSGKHCTTKLRIQFGCDNNRKCVDSFQLIQNNNNQIIHIYARTKYLFIAKWIPRIPQFHSQLWQGAAIRSQLQMLSL